MQKNPPRNALKLLDWTSHYLGSFDIEGPRLEAEVILCHTLNVEIVKLYLDREYVLSNFELRNYMELLDRRTNYEPVSYIIGYKEFWSLEFEVNRSVLIPRPETESLVQSVLPFLKQDCDVPMKVLEMGTGSGAIIVALAGEAPLHRFYASDISPGAVCVAERNVVKNGFGNKVSFFLSCWTDTLNPKLSCFDLIISNPPYIKTGELRRLQPEVAGYEPRIALDGGLEGIDCIKDIIENSLSYLRRGGLLALEIGWDQGQKVRQIVSSCGGYSKIEIFKDYSGLDRIVHMIKT